MTPITANVPELSTWALTMLGFAGLGFAGYRKSMTAKAKSEREFGGKIARHCPYPRFAGCVRGRTVHPAHPRAETWSAHFTRATRPDEVSP
jgi:hypothetical protein